MKLNRNFYDLLVELVKTNFKMRYQNSFLGVLWVLIKPYATFTVLFIIWSKFVGTTSVENYSVYLLLGIVVYTYFNELIVYGQMSLLENAHIILKVNFPREVAIMSSLISAVINFIINIILVLIIIFILKIHVPIIGLLYFLFLTVSIFILATGMALFTSIFTIQFRDLKNIFELGLFLLYWATPIFYDLNTNIPPGRIRDIIAINPLTIIINQFRASLGIYGDMNLAHGLGIFFGSILILILGVLFFRSNVKNIAEKF